METVTWKILFSQNFNKMLKLSEVSVCVCMYKVHYSQRNSQKWETDPTGLASAPVWALYHLGARLLLRVRWLSQKGAILGATPNPCFSADFLRDFTDKFKLKTSGREGEAKPPRRTISATNRQQKWLSNTCSYAASFRRQQIGVRGNAYEARPTTKG